MNQVRLKPAVMPAAVKSAVAQMATGPEEITAGAAAVLMHDLNEAVDEIVAKAKENTSTEVLAEESNEAAVAADIALLNPVLEIIAKPVIDLSTLVDFIQVKNKQGRYRMNSDKLRHFIHDSMDTRLIDRNMLSVPGDAPETTAARLRLAVQPLELFYQYFRDFEEIEHDDVTASESGLIWDEYHTFFSDLKARYEEYSGKLRAEAKAKLDAHIAAFNSGVVTFDDLEAGLREEARNHPLFMFRDGDQNIAGKLFMVRRQESMFGIYLQIFITVNSHNEEALNSTTHSFNIQAFPETATLESLQVTRVDLTSDASKALIARGQKYLELTQKPSYVKSAGNMTRKMGRNMEVLNAQGRVMIDLKGMTDMDTNYYQYFCKADEGTKAVMFTSPVEASDEIKIMCVPYVYGFSFKAKRWGQLNVAEMEPIEFREDAYEMLVLDQKTKDLIFASVTDNSSDNDIIAGKGGGSINLLEGPPGVGKTLTAEAVAEKLKKPLYMVSAGELGTDVNELEDSLKDILEIANTWKAVLLIDEADIFLETRDKHDVKRNAMVAVFLRLLEYYQGVMFLTTNRADNLDPAFESRITLCIHYTELSYDSRIQVWTNLFKSAKLDNTFDIEQLASHKLNGRQIKGVIKSAGSLARFRNIPVELDHFEEVIAQKADFKAATVFKLGHGLDNHQEAGDNVVLPDDGARPGLFKRILNVIAG